MPNSLVVLFKTSVQCVSFQAPLAACLKVGFVAGALVLSAGASLAASANPAQEGFDQQGSDAAAIAVADQVMEAMGGREAWDNTRHITWKFFGSRLHVWDKWTGDIRVEGVERDTEKPYVALMNLHTKKGRVWVDGEEVSDTVALADKLHKAESSWINDSYWLVMPYKLKDSGVTLKSLPDGEMADGRAAWRLQLTFEGVGRTPDNKYVVYVDKESKLLEQWDFFASANDTEARFSTPWSHWEKKGEILLSGDRGEYQHENIAVYAELPESVYSDPATLELPGMSAEDPSP